MPCVKACLAVFTVVALCSIGLAFRAQRLQG